MAVNEHGDPEQDPRLARLYRAAAREEPPAHVDRSIMAAAREVAQRPAPVQERSSWWTPWRLPFALAALATLSVSLVTLMDEHDPERVASVPPPSPPPAAYEREQAKTAQPSQAPASAAAPAKEPQIRALRREDAREAGPAPLPEAGVASSARSEVARAEAPAPLADAPQARQKASAGDGAAQGAPAESPASVLAERPAPAPSARPAPASKARSAIRGLEVEGYAADAGPSPVARHLAELEGKPSSAWTERVLTLRREGRIAEADALLVELRRRFPDQPLPAELQ